jgi:uncharacterized membrane protein
MPTFTSLVSRALRRVWLVPAFAALACAWPLAAPAQVEPGGEEISAMRVDLTVRADGSVGVTERIEYFFPEERHGLYRDLPLRYTDDEGSYEIPLRNLSVQDRPFAVEDNGVYRRVRIGDPERFVAGAQNYVLSYEAVGALRYFDDHDELYWNATGTAWDVPIRQAAATVHLPPGVDAADVTLRCFTGAHGSTEEDCVKSVSGDAVEFATTAGPLTVVVGWPPGLVARVDPVRLSPWRHLWPYALPALAGLAMAWLWHRYGRDPKGRGTHVVQYDPPDGAPPAVVGVLVDERADARDAAASIVDLAVRGYLKIREFERPGLLGKSVDYEFLRLRDWAGDAAVRPFEAELLDALFAGRQVAVVSSLKQDHSLYLKMKAVDQALYGEVVRRGYFPSDPNKRRLAAAGAGIAAVAVLLLFAWWFGGGLQSMFGIVLEGATTYHAVASLVLVAIEIAVFSQAMPRRSEAGVLAKEHALGFKDYLATAERHRLKWQEQESVFEKFLPYAMVFGVADKWAKAFADVGVKQPAWYEGRPGAVFSAIALNNAVTSMNAATIGAMHSAPSKSGSGSGFSGGGFSGGGGGGGGGGSW